MMLGIVMVWDALWVVDVRTGVFVDNEVEALACEETDNVTSAMLF